VISGSKSLGRNADADIAFVDGLDRSKPFVALTVEDQAVVADVRAENASRMVRFGFIQVYASAIWNLVDEETGQRHSEIP
jgi:hypothetical protein